MPLTQIPITGQGQQVRSAAVLFFSDPIQIRSSYEWSITFTFTGLDADPIFSVLGSNDNIVYSNIAAEIGSTVTGFIQPVKILLTKAFSDPINGIDGCRQETFPFEWIQISYEPNGATTGTVSAILSLMIDE